MAGTVRRVALEGADADGQLAHWRLVSGPTYARVLDLQRRPGGAAGILELTPALCEVGSNPAVIGLSDGVSETLLPIQVEVLPNSTAPGTPLFRASHSGVALATGDFDRDGHPDMATADGAGNSVTVFRTLPAGGLQKLGETPVDNGPGSIAAGDFDEDGVLDLVVTTSTGITVLIGNGQGSFQPLPAQPFGNTPILARSAHVNRDEHLDLLVANAGTNTISALLGDGDGTFTVASEAPVGGADFAGGDLNLDGRLDLVVAVATAGAAGEVRILSGFGDGTFRESSTLLVEGSPSVVVVADWNTDGRLDLGVGVGNAIRTFLARNDGSFEQSDSFSGFFGDGPLVAGDLDLDGNQDIVVDNSAVNAGLQVYRGAGDGTFPAQGELVIPNGAANGIAFDDADRDGYPDLFITSVDLGEVMIRMSPYAGLGAAHARTFSKNDKPIHLNGNGGSICILLEPVSGSYTNPELIFTSLLLRSPGTGSVSEISAIQNKNVVESDVDRNGVREVAVCFARSDMSRLFDQLQGKQTVTASLRGNVLDGRAFCTDVTLEIIGSGEGGSLAAAISPNPLNPRATLRFSTSRSGAVKVRMYDLHGRVVRTLLQRPMLPAGNHEVEIDGRSENGQTLASGVYFYAVEAAEGTVRGRLTVLK